MRPIAKKFSTGLLLAAITFLAILAGSAIGQTGAVQPPPKQESSDIRPLESGKEIERELAGGAVHIYSISLAAGQFVRVVVEQRGIDVVATLIEPGGKKVVEIDSPNGTDGPETVMAITEVAGSYQLEVRSFEKSAVAGKYSIRLEEVRLSTETDRKKITAITELNEAVQLNSRADTLVYEGKLDEAQTVAERALAIREKLLGADDLYVAQSLSRLGYIYRNKGDFLRAESVLRRAILIYEKTPHFDQYLRVIVALRELANLYRDKGDYANAESLLKRTITISENSLGLEHQETAKIVNDLGYLYHDIGDYLNGEMFFKRALALFEKVYGSESREVSTALANLASLYQDKGDYVKAEPLYLRALLFEMVKKKWSKNCFCFLHF